MPVQLQKDAGRCQRDSLVPVSKRVISCERVCVGCRQAENVGRLIEVSILGCRKSAVESTLVKYSRDPSMLSEKSFMYGQHGRLREPLGLPAHLARSRRAFLYRFMKPSAVSMVFLKSGS